MNIPKTTLENVKKVVLDFTADLSLTFPEFSFLWEKWVNPELSDDDAQILLDYCLKVYPERFFDILYQNDDIFLPTSEINVFFLPNVDFKMLFNCNGITENTRRTMWKYIQLIMFSIIGNVDDKSRFGENGNIFEGLQEDELRSKLEDAMSGIGEFFQKMSGERDSDVDSEGSQNTFTFDKIDGMPNVDEMHSHLKGLFDGKIGKLAKELAEEITHDLGNLMDDSDGSVKTTQDVFQKIIKNPGKMMDLIKVVNQKLTSKMQSGDISQEDIMSEASQIIGKMKDMGGNMDFQEMMKGMMKNMGGMAGMTKGAKVDVNALNRMTQGMATKDRLRQKLAAKQAASPLTPITNANIVPDSLFPTENPNNFVFSLPEKQEMTPLPDKKEEAPKSAPKKAKKKKGKK
jgi:hypothetical protein